MVKRVKLVRKTTRRKVARRPRMVSRPILDRRAIEYAKLLSDPCNGPLVHGLANDWFGGILSRVEFDFVANQSGTETGSFGVYVPGLNQLWSSGVAIVSDSTPLTPTVGAVFPFISSSTVGTYRCLSACLQLMYPGAELNRSGVIAMGNFVSGDVLDLPGTLTTGYLRSACQYSQRMPAGTAALSWRPTAQDLNFVAANAGDLSSNALETKHGAIAFSTAGGPAGVGVRVRVVAVYEWRPPANFGINTGNRFPSSNNTLAQVLNYLDSRGDWLKDAGRAIGRASGRLIRGAGEGLLGEMAGTPAPGMYIDY